MEKEDIIVKTNMSAKRTESRNTKHVTPLICETAERVSVHLLQKFYRQES